MNTIDQKIARALGVGTDRDDETRIASLVELVKSEDQTNTAFLDGYEAEANDLIEQNLDDLREAQHNITNLINMFAVLARNITASANEEEE